MFDCKTFAAITFRSSYVATVKGRFDPKIAVRDQLPSWIEVLKVALEQKSPLNSSRRKNTFENIEVAVYITYQSDSLFLSYSIYDFLFRPEMSYFSELLSIIFNESVSSTVGIPMTS